MNGLLFVIESLGEEVQRLKAELEATRQQLSMEQLLREQATEAVHAMQLAEQEKCRADAN